VRGAFTVANGVDGKLMIASTGWNRLRFPGKSGTPMIFVSRVPLAIVGLLVTMPGSKF
jgi:hypothetical protein